MSKYFRVRNDFIQKVSVGKDGCVDLLEFASIAYRIKQCLVIRGKRVEVFSAAVVGGQLQ